MESGHDVRGCEASAGLYVDAGDGVILHALIHEFLDLRCKVSESERLRNTPRFLLFWAINTLVDHVDRFERSVTFMK